MPTYGNALTVGIQDIAAFLPLLGTEQCETHVASALSDGYLFAAASPLSIFGTLGLVVAGYKAFVASIVGYSGLPGAEFLKNAGFSPSGKNLELIMMNFQSEHPNRHLIETRIENIWKRFGVTDVAKGEVPDAVTFKTPDIAKWVLSLFLSAATFSLLNVTAYLHFILKMDNRLPRSLCLIFPFVRLTGAFLIVTSLQFLVLIRLHAITKARVKFWSLNSKVKEKFPEERYPQLMWDPENASEKCLSSLRKQIESLEPLPHRYEGIFSLFKRRSRGQTNVCVEEAPFPTSADLEEIKQLFDKPLIKEDGLLRPSVLYPLKLFFRFTLLLGIMGCLAGYVGCFSIVRGAATSRGPFIWLSIEIALSFLRVLVWSSDPKWDNMRFTLHRNLKNYLSRTNMITVQSKEEINNHGLILTPAPQFLDFIKQTSAVFPKGLNYPDISLLYALSEDTTLCRDRLNTAASETTKSEAQYCGRTLYILIYDHLRNTAAAMLQDERGIVFKYAKLFRENLRAEIGDYMHQDSIFLRRADLMEALEVHFHDVNGYIPYLLGSNGVHPDFVECNWEFTTMTNPDRKRNGVEARI